MTKRAFVLLSGGIDSTTCLYRAIDDFAPSGFKASELEKIGWVEAVSVDYGQRHLKEAEYAARTCEQFGIVHTTINVGALLSGAGVMLTDASEKIPDISYDEIKGVSPTYVPFRNGTMLSLITAHAQKWVNERIKERAQRLHMAMNPPMFADKAMERATAEMKDSAGIYFGAHAEDAHNWAYPDCTPEFIGAMANAIYVGSYSCIRLYTPLEWAGKAEIIRMGTELGVDWAGTWSCYAGGVHHCGTCPTCRARRAGFIAAGVPDPTVYARDAA